MASSRAGWRAHPHGLSSPGIGDSALATSSSRYRIGLIAAIALVALRVGIGWHFYREGVNKLHDESFTSVGFFRGSHGTFAPLFQLMIWDADGRIRLNQTETERAWEDFRDQVATHYEFDDQQRKKADQVWKDYHGQLREFFLVNGEDVDEYLLGLDRYTTEIAKPARHDVPSLAEQAAQWEADLGKKRAPWLAQLDGLWSAYEKDLNAIASASQKSQGPLKITRPGQSWITTDLIDQVIPWFDTVIGACLILGLFTRVASVFGAGFLAMVVATQWPPWSPGAAPVYYQSIEMLSLLVLAAVGAGRFAGLDFFLWALRMRCCPPKTGNRS